MRRTRALVLAPIVLCLFHSAGRVARGDYTLSTLVSFSGDHGAGPSGVVLDAQGNLYGTTGSGGLRTKGAVIEVAAGTRALSTLAIPGGQIHAGVTLDAQGNLYGTTTDGGVNGHGSVFELVNNAAVVPEPASLIILGQVATILGGALAVRARGRRARPR